MTLDALDFRIISYLAQDGRASGEKIAHQLGIDEGTCRFRMRKLIGNLVHIKGFVNPALVGFPIAAFLALKIQPADLLAAEEKLARFRRMVQVNAIAGTFDIMGLALFRSGRDVTTVMQEIYEQVAGVREMQAIICLETTLGFYARVLPELLLEARTKTALDDVDKKIVAALIENGRLTARDISRAFSIPEAQARRRLKRLLDDKVISVGAVVDAGSIGLPVVALVGFKVELPKIREVAAVLARHQQINYVTTCAGEFDILAAGMFRSTSDLRMILQQFVSLVAGIRDTQTFICFDESASRSQWVPRGLNLIAADEHVASEKAKQQHGDVRPEPVGQLVNNNGEGAEGRKTVRAARIGAVPA